MSLVYILASAPWGPVRIEAAASVGDMMRTVTMQPAHVETIGTADAGQVVEAARTMLPALSASGWIDANVAAAIQAVREAHKAVSATIMAREPVEAAPEPPVSHGGADALVFAQSLAQSRSASAAHVEAGYPAHGSNAARLSKNEHIRVRRQAAQTVEVAASPDIDPAAVRRGLGLTQTDFAMAFGLSVGTVRDWEQGKNAPDRV